MFKRLDYSTAYVTRHYNSATGTPLVNKHFASLCGVCSVRLSAVVI